MALLNTQLFAAVGIGTDGGRLTGVLFRKNELFSFVGSLLGSVVMSQGRTQETGIFFLLIFFFQSFGDLTVFTPMLTCESLDEAVRGCAICIRGCAICIRGGA